MNQNIANLFNTESPMESFFKIMMAPDEEFDKHYEELLIAAQKAIDSKQVQDSMLNNIGDIPIGSEEAELNELEEMLKELNEDDSLSQNKKNVLSIFIKGIGELALDLRKNPRERIRVGIYRTSEDAIIPTYANPSDAGADIYSPVDITLEPNSTTLVPTNLKVEIPAGYAIFIYPRSGMSYKTKIRVANSVGVIDHLYHEEIKVIMDNNSNEPYTIKKGDRIAQMIIMPVPMITFQEADKEFDDNGRSGFGSTGQ